MSSSRKSLALRWAAFAVAALAASCCTPYGWNSLLASQKILGLGGALPLIMEWKPADFGSVGAFEICLLLGIGLALLRGVKLPPLRIVLLLGLLHMALAPGPRRRNSGAAGADGARRAAGAADRWQCEIPMHCAARRGCCYTPRWPILLVAATFAFASLHRFEPIPADRRSRPSRP